MELKLGSRFSDSKGSKYTTLNKCQNFQTVKTNIWYFKYNREVKLKTKLESESCVVSTTSSLNQSLDTLPLLFHTTRWNTTEVQEFEKSTDQTLKEMRKLKHKTRDLL